MSASDEGIGCRQAAIATAVVLIGATVLFWSGLAMVLNDGCTGLCGATGLSLLYAGAPVSALFGVLGGGLPIAWPLDITLWVVVGFLVAGWATRRKISPFPPAIAVLGIALAYGLVTGRLVELVV